MPRSLLSFDDGSMEHIPVEDWPEVSETSHAVVQEAKEAGVWIFGGGVERQQAISVGTNGAITDGPDPRTKAVVVGFSIIEVLSREQALDWAARIASGCRCAQEVRRDHVRPGFLKAGRKRLPPPRVPRQIAAHSLVQVTRRLARRLLLASLMLTLTAFAAYLYGRYQCPPPGWWVQIFVPSGNWGCVAHSPR